MNKELLNTKLVRELLSAISAGVYPPGKRLASERRLCEQFAVSRGTVRQAIADLVKMGVLEAKQGSGTYVKKITYSKLPGGMLPQGFEQVSLADIITARKAIETTAVTLACRRITKKEFAELEKLIDGMMQSLENLPEFLDCDMKFHQAFVRAGGNVVLVTAFDAISEYHKFSQVYTSTHEGLEQTAIDYHLRILYALQKANPQLAQKAVTEHLDEILEAGKQKN